MIELQNVTFKYRKGAEALRSVSATLHEGTYLMLGENGAGKTSLLKVMCGLIVPQTGRCLIDGLNVDSRSAEALSRVFFLGDETCFPAPDIHSMVLCHAPFYPTFSAEVLRDCLAAFGFTGTERLDRMSLGMRRKAMLAYAISLRTDLLLLDEPANGLDINSKQILARLLARHSREGQTVVVSTHTVQDLEYLFDGLLYISHGEMILDASIECISNALEFATSPMPLDGALYQEAFAGLYRGLLPAIPDAPADSRPDLSLLYNALCSPSRDNILSIINSTPHDLCC
ncbi:MAG: ABC transporter ATP-binding protein [Candidatus Amulumruptor caecigallinarius]|nr:ABC transporter ATP-binding protein [Candidatus Amulumruptor caecigallinarius]MCM1397701.1 ABC transporter ATP-binding protein [Candidatus Amulumruptor caecigallinarius]MCM1454717.1 ABC transporter ATP-binding protein [bacterium]